MYVERRDEAWRHTARLAATLINLHLDPKKHTPVTGADLHPYCSPASAAPPLTRVSAADFRRLVEGH